MILLFDVGNTALKMAFVKEDEIIKTYLFSTDVLKKADDFYLLIHPLISKYIFKKAAIASVVPHKTKELREMILKHFYLKPFVVEPGVKTGLKIIADNPLEVGADIIAASVLYQNALIIDLGTAVKYLYVKNNTLRGVVIAPGLETSLKALVDNTALLPNVEIKVPKTILGNNTVSCMQSGLVYGLVAQIEGMIKKISLEVNELPPVYLTGGYSELVYPLLEEEVIYESKIVLLGLLKILKKNL